MQRVVAHFQRDPEVRALILGGSLAHGFARPDSDIDILIVVSGRDYQARRQEGRLTFFSRELCTYDSGYADGKYLDVDFLRRVAAQGSEPARFAFADARVLFSQVDGLAELVREIARYPAQDKVNRIRRFHAQLDAWNWFTGETLKLGDPYLLGVAVSKLALFGGRLILAHNELLYPYHKWFLKVLETAKDRPRDLLPRIRALYEDPSRENIRLFYETVKNFREWETPDTAWPMQFMADNELTWMNGFTAIDDL
ncbi:MAG: nucleotidyltransferase domain-containing protein [Anaerolineae bacterium]|nr:nucleotidyltransferase domain-containing protein [Anaerolineae bacterium]